mmetsp:Transcript_56128/g.127591  ORF Transcript_56128/g.127591 Transcript_56128/m.127591 type:complete len:115 (+) Transcript_56128:3-347(+)
MMGRGGYCDDDAPTKTERVFTIKVGRQPSKARYYVDEVEEVSELLKSLASAVRREGNLFGPSSQTLHAQRVTPKTTLADFDFGEEEPRMESLAYRADDSPVGGLEAQFMASMKK